MSRLTTMVRYAIDLPVEVIESQVASALDLVVQTTRSSSGERYVSSLASFRFDREERRCVVRKLYDRARFRDRGIWLVSPKDIASQALGGTVCANEESGQDVEAAVRTLRDGLDLESEVG